MKDFLGNEYAEGDIVVYPAGSGRSITMIKARVVKIKETGVTVQPLGGSRWQQHHTVTRYIDSRNGKPFGAFGVAAQQHQQRPFGYHHKDTGEWLSYEDVRALSWDERRVYVWAPVIWKDYVLVEKVGPKPVNLKITENIVKITDLVPDEQEEQ